MNTAGLGMIEARSLEAVVGASVYDIIAPEDRREWRANHDRVCAGERINWEFEIIGLSGTRRRMETHTVPLVLPDGTKAQLAVTRDITARTHAETALRSSEAQLRALADNLPYGIMDYQMARRRDGSERRFTFMSRRAHVWVEDHPAPRSVIPGRSRVDLRKPLGFGRSMRSTRDDRPGVEVAFSRATRTRVVPHRRRRRA